MISLEALTLSFGADKLLDNISLHVSEKDKIGLVGRNGAGKSTLMRLICGLQKPTAGRVDVPAGLAVAYLPQMMEHNKGRSVMEEVLTSFAYIGEMQRETERLSVELSERTDYQSEGYAALVDRLAHLNERLVMEGGEPPEAKAAKVLKGLGFKEEDFGARTETFSQGWNMRIELAKLLLSGSDVLLLDEPTNHLDIESIDWLESYLHAWNGALMLVSHDRRFLDGVTQRTVEISLGKLYDYKVPYSKFLALRQERIEQQTAAYQNQRKMIENTEAFIERFRYKATKSNQVQSRIKALEKLDRIEIDNSDNSRLIVRFPPAPRSGDVVYKAEGLSAGYPGKLVARDVNVEIRRGEKVAFVGRNGEGKTTLMKIIAGELDPLDGVSRLGHNVLTGYFAQNQDDSLDKKLTVFQTLDYSASGEIRTRLRDILAQFLFSGEDIDKKVAVLSGGERARLGMARLMLQPYNLLALDEPTNHMDIKSKDILKQALKSYDGTLVVVSHDRDFLDGLVDKIYEFRDGKVSEFLGSVEDFLASRRMDSLRELERPRKVQSDNLVPNLVPNAVYAKQKAEGREKSRVLKRIAYLEMQIEKKEQEQKEIESRLAQPGEKDDILELTRQYLENKRSVDSWTEEWADLSQSI